MSLKCLLNDQVEASRRQLFRSLDFRGESQVRDCDLRMEDEAPSSRASSFCEEDKEEPACILSKWVFSQTVFFCRAKETRGWEAWLLENVS